MEYLEIAESAHRCLTRRKSGCEIGAKEGWRAFCMVEGALKEKRT
jgi:hypothetical protein